MIKFLTFPGQTLWLIILHFPHEASLWERVLEKWEAKNKTKHGVFNLNLDALGFKNATHLASYLMNLVHMVNINK